MKKVLSILLAAMLILGMLPATALAAEETVTYTFSNYTAGTQYAKNEEHELDDVVTVVTNDCHFTSQLRIYSSSTNNGYAIIKSTKQITAFAMNAGNKKDTVTISGSNDDGATWVDAGSIATTTTSYKDYPAVTFATSYKWLKLDVAGSNQVRIASMTLTFAEDSSGGETPNPEPECTHPNKTEMTDGYAAQCGIPGKTNSVYCPDCEETVTPQEEIPALTHNYVDGTCEHCGAAEPVAPEIPTDGYYKQVTDLADVTAGGQFVIVANYNGTNYAMNLATGSGRLSTTEVTVVGDSIVVDNISTLPGWIVVPADGGIALKNGDNYLICSSSTSFSVGANVHVFTVSGSETFTLTSASVTTRGVAYQKTGNCFGAYATSNATDSGYQFNLSLYKLVAGEAEVVESTLTFVEQGATTKTETAEATKSYTMPAATNAAPEGYTFAGWVEAQVKETAIAPETVYAAGSSYTVGNDATFYALYTRTEVQEGEGITAYVAKDISEINDGNVVVITMTKGGTVYALPNNGGTSAPAANVTVTENADGQLVADFENILWDLDKDGDNLIFYVHGSTKDYLYCTNTNNGVKVGNGDAKTFVVDTATGYLKNIQTSDTRYIGIYNTQDWRCYTNTTGNIANQTLKFYVETTITGTVETTYYTTCVNHSYASGENQTVVCSNCGETKAAAASVGGVNYATVQEAINAMGEMQTVKLYAPVESISRAGNLYLDLNGNNVGSVTLAGDLFVFDTKATTAAAGAKIDNVNVNYIEKDFTADGKRYIALKEGDGYSVHVLELQLTAVTLRTTKAGIYYKAKIVCDPTLAAATDTYGVVLSVQDMPDLQFATEMNGDKYANGWTAIANEGENVLTSGKVFTSGSVFGIFKEGLDNNAARGAQTIYANAYLKLKDEFGGIYVMSDQNYGAKESDEGFHGISFSLKGVMEKLDNQVFSGLSEAQKTRVAQFYKDWESAMSTWNLPAISAAAANLPAAE